MRICAMSCSFLSVMAMSRCLKCDEFGNYRTLFLLSQPFAGGRGAKFGAVARAARKPLRGGPRVRPRGGSGGRLESRHARVLYLLAKSTLESLFLPRAETLEFVDVFVRGAAVAAKAGGAKLSSGFRSARRIASRRTQGVAARTERGNARRRAMIRQPA
ncbi:hypothetical protein [Burkholderia mayonis]|uniref:hypothetical protein n=1 Tax=Burkholderia mayonis TaxID=1385591 RepID=UPI0013967AB3|nr:hypothetical protein [Burkholderia mayonis]